VVVRGRSRAGKDWERHDVHERTGLTSAVPEPVHFVELYI
jgi:hypothetical protein